MKRVLLYSHRNATQKQSNKKAQTIKGVKAVVGEVSNVDRDGLRQLVDSLRQKLGTGVVALGMPEDGKVALIVGVTKDLTSRIQAGRNDGQDKHCRSGQNESHL